jgi:hypothetical protein
LARRHIVKTGVPTGELQQIVAMTAASCYREFVGRQAIEEGLHQASGVFIAVRGCIAQH